MIGSEHIASKNMKICIPKYKQTFCFCGRNSEKILNCFLLLHASFMHYSEFRLKRYTISTKIHPKRNSCSCYQFNTNQAESKKCTKNKKTTKKENIATFGKKLN